jgi:predicted transcriptional regulator
VNTEKVSPHLTAKIVRGYVRHHRLGPDQLPDMIASIHQALGQLGQPSEPEEIRTPAVSIRQSVRHDHVVCLDCGYRGKTLRRHLGVRHGLKGDEYRRRWGLRSDHPLTHRTCLFRATLHSGERAWPGSKIHASGGPATGDIRTRCGRCRGASRDQPQTEADPSLQIEVRCE